MVAYSGPRTDPLGALCGCCRWSDGRRSISTHGCSQRVGASPQRYCRCHLVLCPLSVARPVGVAWEQWLPSAFWERDVALVCPCARSCACVHIAGLVIRPGVQLVMESKLTEAGQQTLDALHIADGEDDVRIADAMARITYLSFPLAPTVCTARVIQPRFS
jgi:hypothetical protein